MSEESIYEKCVNQFGIPPQFLVTMEECGELITALNHFMRGKIKKEDLAKEIADVEIMCIQLRHIIGSELVDQKRQEIEEKLKKML